MIPSLRGSGLAEELLMEALQDAKAQGIRWAWVEHGTANPNARGFWDKYFEACSYEMIRNIRY